MENNLSVFFKELVRYYRDQEEIQYIWYDGSSAPKAVEKNPRVIRESKPSLEAIQQ